MLRKDDEPMTNQDIIRKVQVFFDAPDLTTNSIKLFNNDNTRSAVAVRMINAYQRFIAWQTAENQIEFECSLRNYLLFLKTDIKIKDYKYEITKYDTIVEVLDFTIVKQ